MEDLNERDLFAMMALCGMLANTNNPTTKPDRAHAQEAYDIADAMMLARQPKGENHGS